MFLCCWIGLVWWIRLMFVCISFWVDSSNVLVLFGCLFFGWMCCFLMS